MNAAAPRLETAIREHLAPVLRADGFAGSGRTFRRLVNGWVQVVNVQGSRYGGQFAVNLALQPSVIPDVRGETPDPKKITEELCEFRRRMSDSQGRQDRWWKHESSPESMARAVQDAASTYAHTGRNLLDQAVRSDSDLNTVSAESFAAGRYNFFGFGSTECRMALALARLRAAQGKLDESHAFAEHALKEVGSATFLKAQIQALLPQHDA